MISILYVDDEPLLLELGKHFLEREKDFRVVLQESASSALELLETEHFDVIISDYQMPDIDGLEFLQEVRRRFERIPFILFTGRGREEVVIRAVNLGVDFYLQKGGDPTPQFAELSHKIRQAVQRRQAQEALLDSEQRLSDIINFLPDATLAIDTSGRVIAWNKAIEKMTGIQAADMIGRDGFEYAVPFYGERRPLLIDLILEGDDFVQSHYEHIIRDKDALIADTTLPRLQGYPCTLMAKASPLYNRKGELSGAIESIRDITGRKKSEDELRAANDQLAAAQRQLIAQYDELKTRQNQLYQSERIYRTILDDIQDAYYRTDTTGNLILASPSTVLILEYDSVDELYGKRIDETFYFNPDDRKRFLAEIELNGSVMNYEEVLRKKDGTPVVVLTSSHKYFDKNGVFLGIEGIFRDITERKHIETALCESERRYRDVVEMQTEFICRFLPDGTYVFVNEAYCRYFEKNRDEIIGFRFTPAFPPEDLSMIQRHFASLTRHNPVAELEHRIVMPDGSFRWHWWRDQAVFNESGDIIEYQSVGKDITDRKAAEFALCESEEKFRILADNSPVAITMYQGNHDVYVNDYAAAKTGYTKEELCRMNFWEMIHPDFQGMLQERGFARQQGENIERTYEVQYITRSGEVRWAHISAATTSYRGEPAGIAMLIDITDRKTAENKLQTAYGQLEAAQKELQVRYEGLKKDRL